MVCAALTPSKKNGSSRRPAKTRRPWAFPPCSSFTRKETAWPVEAVQVPSCASGPPPWLWTGAAKRQLMVYSFSLTANAAPAPRGIVTGRSRNR